MKTPPKNVQSTEDFILRLLKKVRQKTQGEVVSFISLKLCVENTDRLVEFDRTFAFFLSFGSMIKRFLKLFIHLYWKFH